MVEPTWKDLEFRKNPYKGKLIVIEGIDGSGKTTSSKALVQNLKNAGYDAMYSKEPTDDVIGSFIREKILTGNIAINPLALQYLFNADRAMHMEKIEKLLAKGTIIVMDRYFWSSVTYAMIDLQKPQQWYYTAFSLLSFYHQFLLPDITFFLKISPGTALERIKKSKKHGEIYDNAMHLPKIEKNYERLIQEFPEEFTIISAERSEKEITEELFQKSIGNQ